jgi:predicted transcriptional regulator YdeE/uncharacterized protein YndB with AHSA1/START domain
MPALSVQRSIAIKAPAQNVFEALNHFENWPKWSPWLILEPEATVTVAEDGKFYDWSGQRVGSGEMKIIHEKENERIDYDLTFLSPWKSHAKVSFLLDEEETHTNVHWTMDSSIPWFMFWMAKSMAGFIGMDYERGLKLLKDFVEKGAVESKLDFLGVSEFKGSNFVGIKTSCALSEIGSIMQADFGKLGAFVMQNPENATGLMFTQYHKWDLKNMQTTYTVGFGVQKVPENLPGDFYVGSIPKTRIYTTRHTGPYLHLGNAWSAMMNLERSKVFKQNKKIHPFEVYVNAPGEVDDTELITDVCFAVK